MSLFICFVTACEFIGGLKRYQSMGICILLWRNEGRTVFLIDFIYLFMRHTERGRDIGRGLDPRTSGSQPEPKADAQPLSHPGIPHLFCFNMSFWFPLTRTRVEVGDKWGPGPMETCCCFSGSTHLYELLVAQSSQNTLGRVWLWSAWCCLCTSPSLPLHEDQQLKVMVNRRSDPSRLLPACLSLT